MRVSVLIRWWTAFIAAAALLLANVARGDDWPTYLHDNERSGVTADKVQLPLHTRWIYTAPRPPAPAWPLPAKQDFWHKLTDLPARVVFDRAFHPVSDGQRLFFGSSADDKVYCLDAKTGKLLWSFFTEGPVRLAPTIAEDKLLLGSDDGHVYCLKSTDGSLIWKTRIAPGVRQIAGNERIISAWPVRTGVLVDDQTAFCCAGIFPDKGVYQAALDVATGKIKASGKISASAQGYLMRKGDKLTVATGQDPAGAVIGKLVPTPKPLGQPVKPLAKEYPYAWIGTPEVRFAGGDGKVAAFSPEGKLLWSAPVDGKAYSLIVANGQLFVSTDKGRIYCFGAQAGPATLHFPATGKFPLPDAKANLQLMQSATWIATAAGTKQGYALILGGDEGQLAYQLAARSKFHIIMLQPDAKKARQARQNLDSAGLSGRVVVQERTAADKLPYTSFLFNLVVRAEDAAKTDALDEEARRVLKPCDGVYVWDVAGRKHDQAGPLAGAGEWTHFYADPGNTACSMDKKVVGPLALQWFGQPGPREMMDRHHRTVAPLWKSGRLIIPGHDRVYGVDSYNGTLLWDVEIKNSKRVGAFRDCSYLVATDDLIYVAAADKCLALKAKTGEQAMTFELPNLADAARRDWGYVACVGELLIGSGVKPGASRREQSAKAIDDTYYDARPLVCSELLFAQDRHGKKSHWNYQVKNGLIINPTIAIGDGLIFFIESNNPDTLKLANGRALPAELLGKGCELVALDLNTGQAKWRKAHDFSAIEHLIYLSYAGGKVVVVGSRNSGKDAKKSKVLYDIAVFTSATGDPLWKHTQQQPTGIGGSHGEQDHHPVIVGDKLICEPFAYHLETGKPLANFAWNPAHRSGCGTLSASASLLFFRQSNPTLFDLDTNKYAKVTTCSRTGCWINMIPAGGLLLIPEASSGCTCNYAVQTSMAFLPVTANE